MTREYCMEENNVEVLFLFMFKLPVLPELDVPIWFFVLNKLSTSSSLLDVKFILISSVNPQKDISCF